MALREIQISEATPGRDVSVMQGSWGQGGVVVEVTAETIVIRAPGDRVMSFDLDGVTRLTVDEPLPADECVQFSDECTGPVEYRAVGQSMSGPPRCEHHLQVRLEQYESSMERYAYSDARPSWFDPTYAGENW